VGGIRSLSDAGRQVVELREFLATAARERSDNLKFMPQWQDQVRTLESMQGDLAVVMEGKEGEQLYVM